MISAIASTAVNHAAIYGNEISPPLVRRMILLFAFGLGGFLIAVLGGLYFGDERRLLCATSIIGGTLLIGIGLGLWCTILFPSTWEWWL